MPPAQARDAGRRLMAKLAAREGFVVLGEHWLTLDARRKLYRYSVRSSRDLRTRSGATSVVFNAVNGQLVGSHLPTGRAAGDTVKHWLTSLHMAAFWGWPLQLMVALIGVVTLALSVTGVWLWWTRRRARQYGPLLAATAASSLNSPASASAARASSTASTPTATKVAPRDR
ncbi:MAG TPA: hypothetical protein DCR74_19520 [Achromobacter sp.]|nr:hypothetical protein [Achromobacter sp.]